MRKYFIASMILLFIQCAPKDQFDPLTHFDRAKQSDIIYKTIRYSAKLAPNANNNTMFSPEFDQYYHSQAADYAFLKIHKRDDGAYDFLLSRPARSITPMFEGIAGQFKLNDRDSLVEYDEVFRTWKMSYKDLTERGSFLFMRMINGEDLTKFYSKTAGDQYIEFPDDRFSYDKNLRRWKDSVFDSKGIN